MTTIVDPQYEVLDNAGHKTGRLLSREAVHTQELWHEVVNIWILNDKGEVLLQLRAPEVELCPNVWDVAVGTHVHPGEDPVAAAQRGLQQELGLGIAPDNLKHLFNIQAVNPMPDHMNHRVLGHIFILKQSVDLTKLRVDANKITRLIWKPIPKVMAEIGNVETNKLYFPRAGEYYPRLFDALLAEAPPEIAN
ncbi:MAG TPA: NUDIX domain-containing protein [Patescibacteria group bacterium]|nr:NUDIX domain-containing protein [Patescibacteria group bacterium]